jgi:hypothetical protein
MSFFYHVSRHDISEIQKFELMQFDGTIEFEDFHTANEFKEYKLDLFPNGISKHGEIYLHNPFKSVPPNYSTAPNEFIIETVFELIRRLKFSTKKSRFISTFGCLTLDDAREIRDNVFKNKGSIYLVSCDNYFKADMKFLRQTASIIGIQIVAEKYWSGLSTSNPFWEILMEAPIRIIKKIE